MSGTPVTRVRRTRLTRTIKADPTSTALLLAGPTAMDLWPGVRRLGDVGGRVLVEAAIPPGSDALPAAAAVRALPPRRTPTSYVSRFQWSGPGLAATEAELVLRYATAAEGTPATQAVLVLAATEVEASRLDEATLSRMARTFLDNLAMAAEARSSAA